MSWKRFFHRRLWDEERARELEAYLEIETEENIARGMLAEEARYAARRKLGNLTLIREEIYRMNTLNFFESLWQDVRCGARMLRKNAGFTAVAVLTLALGIGANTAIFSVIRAVLLRPLPYKDPDRIVLVFESNPSQGFTQFAVSPPNYMDWLKESSVFEQMASLTRGNFNYTSDTGPERLRGARVAASFFPVFGVAPALGRTFLPEDDVSGKAHVVVLSHGLWTRRFGSDPGVLGKTLTLDGQPYAIIGVMPSSFQIPSLCELWLPSEFAPDDLAPGARGAHYLRVMAKLKLGVSIGQAQAEMAAIAKRLEQQYPRTNLGWTTLIESYNEALVGDVRPTLLVLFGAVGFLLLIACANVGNLLLARATARYKEIAVRISLGAGRGRITRQLLTESILLSGIASAGGLLLAEWAIRALRTLPPSNLPRAAGIQLDLTVLAFTAGLACLTGLLFGLTPAIQTTRSAPAETLKEGGRTSSAGRHSVRSALVVLETTLALVLLVGSGLLLKSFVRLQSVDPGYQAKNLLTANVSLPHSKYSNQAQQAQFFGQVLARLQSLPGARAVAAASSNVLLGGAYSFAFATKELSSLSPAEQPSAGFYTVSPDYFRTLGIPLLAGRAFTSDDAAGRPLGIIISHTLAERYFHDRNPLGESLTVGVGGGKPALREIIGVVGDVKDEGFAESGQMTVYLPYSQVAWDEMTLFVRADSHPSSLAAALRSEVLAVDKDQPIAAISTGEELMKEAVAQPQLRTLLLGLFAALALVLASLGIYGVMSNTVAQRTQEIGVRMALGAEASTVLRLILSDGLRLAGLGVVFGAAGAFLLTRLMKSFLFQVAPTDPETFASVTLLLLVVALLACYIPAHRATRVDPVVALRYE